MSPRLCHISLFLLLALTAGCVARGPQFTIERDDTPLEVPEGSIGSIPPVLESVSVLGETQIRMSSSAFSLSGTISPLSQNISAGNEFRMTSTTLAIGAKEISP